MDKKAAFLLVVGIAVVIGVSFWLFRDQDIAFASRVFSGLVNGDKYVRDAIDWASFEAVGTDIGKNYSALPNDQAKLTYSKAFIANFSIGFNSYGLTSSSFANWRIYGRDKTGVTVAVDGPQSKTLLFTISNKGGKRKLVSIQWGK